MTDAAPGPVKVVLERRVHAGAEEAFRNWAQRFVAAAARAAGHEGSTVLTASNSGSSFILLRFASAEALARWESSSDHAALLLEADRVSAKGDALQVRSGMETWFTLPDMPAPSRPPAKWKMAVITWVALLPMVMALSYLLAPLKLPFVAGAVAGTAIPVAMLTWVVMPRATRLLYRWLYPH